MTGAPDSSGPVALHPALPFSVDTWDAGPSGARPAFLSHAHKDHTAGLAAWAAAGGRPSRRIFATEDTLALLALRGEGVRARPGVEVVPVVEGEAMFVAQEGFPAFQVTPLDANHGVRGAPPSSFLAPTMPPAGRKTRLGDTEWYLLPPNARRRLRDVPVSGRFRHGSPHRGLPADTKRRLIGAGGHAARHAPGPRLPGLHIRLVPQGESTPPRPGPSPPPPPCPLTPPPCWAGPHSRLAAPQEFPSVRDALRHAEEAAMRHSLASRVYIGCDGLGCESLLEQLATRLGQRVYMPPPGCGIAFHVPPPPLHTHPPTPPSASPCGCSPSSASPHLHWRRHPDRGYCGKADAFLCLHSQHAALIPHRARTSRRSGWQS